MRGKISSDLKTLENEAQFHAVIEKLLVCISTI
jgi:hypothetical protein